MHLSIRKIFFNLKIALLLLGIGVSILTVELFHLAQYSEHLSALKNQHLLIEKVISSDTRDLKMAAILVKGSLCEIDLSVKQSGDETFFDSLITSNIEQASLRRSLSISSQNFKDNALLWIESPALTHDLMHEKMMSARSAYLMDINRMVDYQIHGMGEAVSMTKITVLIIFVLGLVTFLLYRHRLTQIYHDVHHACAVDINGTHFNAFTKEFDFILKRLARKSSQIVTNPSLLHSHSGLNNEKGLLNTFNAKKAGRATNTLFLCIFEIDHYTSLVNSLSKEDMAALFKKLGDILAMYEQPLDTIAHLKNDQLVFFLSRSSKDSALSECEKIIQSVAESTFSTVQGLIKITLSAGFLLKAPVKSLDEVIDEGRKLIEKAKEHGGNRIAQLRGRADSYR
jgi:GGDEF domain-containing protein